MIKDRLRQLREMAAAGCSRKGCAAAMGVSYQALALVARKHGVKFRHASAGDPNSERSSAMASLYEEGQTLDRIGSQFGVSRERVRQVIKKRHGMTGKDGGICLRSNRDRAARRARQEEQCQQKRGCSVAQYRELVAMGRAFMKAGGTRDRTPIGAFISQRRNAVHHRGIEWKLTLWQWWTIWQLSGRWEERGRGHGYMMCRKGDVGPYVLGNIVIATGSFNAAIQPNNPYRRGHPDFPEARLRLVGNRKANQAGVSHHSVHPGLPKGVTMHKKTRRYIAQISMDGRNKYIGMFPTPELAHAAYLNARAA